MEAAVIDANFAVSLLVKCPWTDASERLLVAWKHQKKSLFAPALWQAEVVSSVRKAVFASMMSEEDALIALTRLPLFGVQIVVADNELLQSSMRWAGRLGQMVAYDAQYLALAERLEASLWTADNRLYNRCRDLGLDFVNLVT